MKIIGFANIEGKPQMVLKSDSCMLVNRKPFFAPDDAQDLRMSHCVVLRVSRLGKSIEQRFADRYYDAVAPGLDFVVWDKLEEARRNGSSWTEALDFDYSLAIGEWIELVESQKSGQSPKVESLLISPKEAIEQASRLMTIRQGDLIYIDTTESARRVERNEVIEGPEWAKDKLYCKIK